MDSIAKINRILARKGMTGAQLSRIIGVSSGTYSTWNTRQRKISSINLCKIAEALEVSVESLMDDAEEPNPGNKPQDIDETAQYIKDNPEMRVLFSKLRNATPQQLLAIAQMVESFRNGG